MLFRTLIFKLFVALGGFFSWQKGRAFYLEWMLCLRKAFSPSTRVEELNITVGTHDQYILRLRREYGARNTRHLMYLRYERHSLPHKDLKASERGLQILAALAKGDPYAEIASKYGITVKAVEKHLDKLKDDNFLQDSDELIVLFADWENGHR